MIVRPAPAEHYAWIAQRAGLRIGTDFRAVEAVDGDRILGMVGFDGWTPNSAAVHVAVDHPIALRRLIGHSFETAFNGLGKGLLLASVLSTNGTSLRLVRRLGFRPLARIYDGWQPGVDLLIFEMRRDECRWLKR